LIAPWTTGDGANKDVVPVFLNRKNVAVFQWFYRSPVCEVVSVKLLDSKFKERAWDGKAYIHSGYWNSRKWVSSTSQPLIDDLFHVTNLPAVVGNPQDENAPFGVFAVQLDSILTSDGYQSSSGNGVAGYIQAECIPNVSAASSGEAYNRPDDVQRYLGGIPLKDDKVWTGSGSVISHLDDLSNLKDRFGINIDYARVNLDGKSEATFQWYSSQEKKCSSLSIKAVNGKHAAVSIKKWNATEATFLGNVALPYRLDVSAASTSWPGDGY
jgi:hypothetical protein